MILNNNIQKKAQFKKITEGIKSKEEWIKIVNEEIFQKKYNSTFVLYQKHFIAILDAIDKGTNPTLTEIKFYMEKGRFPRPLLRRPGITVDDRIITGFQKPKVIGSGGRFGVFKYEFKCKICGMRVRTKNKQAQEDRLCHHHRK